MARFIFKLSLFFVVALGLVGCGDWFSWHQKMTVTIETPNGDVSASSVGVVSWRHEKLVPGAPGGNTVSSFVGEATIVDLGNGKYLFALIKDAATLAQFAVLEKKMLRAPFSERGVQLEQVGRKGVVPLNKYPMLVTFTDINNPASVKLVDPANLAATFGAGYALKSITLEITDEPVTTGKVESVLGAEFFKKWGSIHKTALKRGLKDPFFKSFMSDLGRGYFLRNSK